MRALRRIGAWLRERVTDGWQPLALAIVVAIALAALLVTVSPHHQGLVKPGLNTGYGIVTSRGEALESRDSKNSGNSGDSVYFGKPGRSSESSNSGESGIADGRNADRSSSRPDAQSGPQTGDLPGSQSAVQPGTKSDNRSVTRPDTAGRTVLTDPEPLTIAHRGDSSAPENSIASIEAAGRRHADYAEIDARLTSDGEVVVFHDRATGRLALGGRNRLVSDLTLRQLQGMPMISRGSRFSVPTLDQAIAAAKQTSNGLGLLVELKTDVRHATSLTNKVLSVVERQHFAGKVLLMSTNPDVVRVMRGLAPAPTWRVGYCYHKRGRMDWRTGADFLVVRSQLLDNGILTQAQRAGIPVFAGVGGYSDEAGRFTRLGVNGVLGDDARAIRGEMDRVMRDGRSSLRDAGARHRAARVG